MVRRRAVILKQKTWQIIARIIRDYLAGRLTNRPDFEDPQGRRGRGDFIGIANGSIAPKANGSVFIATEDASSATGEPWTATADTRACKNDTGLTIPTGTRVYFRKIRGRFRIYFAAICTD